MSYEALLLMGFGGPERPEEVPSFIASVLEGRPVPPERVEKVIGNYRLIGGRSPYNELTFRQAEALRRLLAREGPQLAVYLGMRHAPPFLVDTLREMAASGITHALGIILAPQQGEATWGRYEAALNKAQDQLASEQGSRGPVIDFCDPWYNHPLFIEAAVDQLNWTLNKIPAERRFSARLLFTAHSVPILSAHPYVGQLRETAGAIAAKVGRTEWDLVYQSRSGNPRDPWLEPDVCEAVERCGKAGAGDVVIVPISFICDNAEVLFDLDYTARRLAEARGFGFYRAPTVSNHPSFIRMLADVVRRACEGHLAQ